MLRLCIFTEQKGEASDHGDHLLAIGHKWPPRSTSSWPARSQPWSVLRPIFTGSTWPTARRTHESEAGQCCARGNRRDQARARWVSRGRSWGRGLGASEWHCPGSTASLHGIRCAVCSSSPVAVADGNFGSHGE